MKELSVEAGLSQTYRNHCVRATVCTVLNDEGVPAREIMDVTGHKSASSLDHYINKTSLKKKASLSRMLHNHTTGDGASTSTNDAEEQQMLPTTAAPLATRSPRMSTTAEVPLVTRSPTINVSQGFSLSQSVTGKLATLFPGATIENIENFHVHFHNQ
jgi:hypothetical protein